MTAEQQLTHIDERGEAAMVDVGSKAETQRLARAGGRVLMRAETLQLVQAGDIKKGDVLAVARIAGIMAAKRDGGADPALSSPAAGQDRART